MTHESLDALAFAGELDPVNLTESDLKRFHAKVDVGPSCHNWTSAITPTTGYGAFNMWRLKRVYTAHRISFFISRGYLPSKLLICHSCDNRKCVNPDHLFVGTHKDNSQDMLQKGRSWVANNPDKAPRGETHKSSVLTEMMVRGIKSLFAQGYNRQRLAERYGVSLSAIKSIGNGHSWKHVV